jgi:hypothetical protein
MSIIIEISLNSFIYQLYFGRSASIYIGVISLIDLIYEINRIYHLALNLINRTSPMII